jgi:RsiW-degrading membrane proteinase PrsW (M82 family)
MKAAAILWIVEKRPYLFRSKTQILTAAMASGLWFAVIENFLYLNVYIANPSPAIIAWRWSVCVLLHVGCTFLVGLGLSRVWEHTMTARTRPQLSIASKFLMAAVICHAAYNTLAVLITAAKEFV